MNTITFAGFIITVEHLIYAYGTTEAEALAMLRQEMGSAGIRIAETDEDGAQHDFGEAPPLRMSACCTWPATAALLADVAARGGDIGWSVVGGIACTDAEAGEG